MKAGTEDAHQVLLLSGAHLESVRVRHDVGLLLAGLEIPDLLSAKDKEVAAAACKPAADDKTPPSKVAPDACFNIMHTLLPCMGIRLASG